MKHLILATDTEDFNHLQNLSACHKTHVVVCNRSDDEYNKLVEQYEESPEDAKYIYPKRTLIKYDTQKFDCEMEYSTFINPDNNKLYMKVKITKIDSNIDLSNYILHLEQNYVKSKGSDTIDHRYRNTGLFLGFRENYDTYMDEELHYIENPKLNTEYIFRVYPVVTYLLRGYELIEKIYAKYNKRVLENNFNCNLKIRPALHLKDGCKIPSDEPRPITKIDFDLKPQDYLSVNCKLSNITYFDFTYKFN
jgi:hypothetical protein